MTEVLPIDTHVHLHSGMEPEACLDAAHHNMSGVWGHQRTGALFLADVPGGVRLDDLPCRLGRWTLDATEETVSRIARCDHGGTLILVAGRQIVTAERLEVLGIGHAAPVPDGMPLAATVRQVTQAQGIAILPWGAGKWTGARLAALRSLVTEARGARSVFLADSGVRPALLPRPRLFAEAEASGWRVLAGTDPLPLPGEMQKPGRLGSLVTCAWTVERPFAALADALQTLDASPPRYGHLESLPRAVRQQVAMQWRKRAG
ncbi:hypothetical protein OCH239_17105 [Roseivivax halodurans JCM 10272]|uniref:Amidohydrolase-related domain-containing protein n=1 Tax=Roseivivax halodurans JCM 10272 TaxID=1449350 RepID=X7ECD7_9RHOB|nr:hypothetical protein [Roseivivax halodurans]ETX12783.1 hypothetical protein OCH239_17105 [Roseivivax halodurans JCM 10272]